MLDMKGLANCAAFRDLTVSEKLVPSAASYNTVHANVAGAHASSFSTI
jgi:hypothetical protein